MPDFKAISQIALQHPQQLGRIGLVYGGNNSEREISLQSGKYCLQALQTSGVDVDAIEVSDWSKDCNRITSQRFDCLLNLIHGAGGEDGCLQGLLELYQQPFVGSDLKACSLAMDKMLCKQIWQSQLNTPKAILVSTDSDLKQALKQAELNLPVVVKPNREGSSNGISIVHEVRLLQAACLEAWRFDNQAIIEQYIKGSELTVTMLADNYLMPIEIVPKGLFYDYQAKYVDNTGFHCPPISIDKSLIEALKKQAKVALDLIAAKHWGRVDFIVDETSKAWILEVNLIPGMTSHSLVPMAAKQAGIGFEQLVCGLVAVNNSRFQNLVKQQHQQTVVSV